MLPFCMIYRIVLNNCQLSPRPSGQGEKYRQVKATLTYATILVEHNKNNTISSCKNKLLVTTNNLIKALCLFLFCLIEDFTIWLNHGCAYHTFTIPLGIYIYAYSYPCYTHYVYLKPHSNELQNGLLELELLYFSHLRLACYTIHSRDGLYTAFVIFISLLQLTYFIPYLEGN